MADADPVLYDLAGGVATITLNRPDAMNAMTKAAKTALLEALLRAAGDDTARAVVLTGSGRAFCTGQDLKEHQTALDSGVGLEDTVRLHYNPIIRAITEVPKPVVAAVNGMAAGAGASFAFACDFRIAAESAAFLMAFARVGLTGDSGVSWTLPRLIGHARATAMLMLAEPVSAAQALEMGMVNGVVPDADLPAAVAEFAGRLAAGPTAAYGLIKAQLAYAASATLPDALEREAVLQEQASMTEDHATATRAFVAKQKPAFQGR